MAFFSEPSLSTDLPQPEHFLRFLDVRTPSILYLGEPELSLAYDLLEDEPLNYGLLTVDTYESFEVASVFLECEATESGFLTVPVPPVNPLSRRRIECKRAQGTVPKHRAGVTKNRRSKKKTDSTPPI